MQLPYEYKTEGESCRTIEIHEGERMWLWVSAYSLSHRRAGVYVQQHPPI